MKKFLAISLLMSSLSAMAAEYQCYGTSPFWGAKINSTTLTYGPGGVAPLTEKITAVKNAANRGTGYVQIIKTNTTSATLINEVCNDSGDGLPDSNSYYHIVLETPNAVLYGCCDLKK